MGNLVYGGNSMPKKVLIAIPREMLIECDQVAMVEHRTRSDLFREALRRYLQGARKGNAALAREPALVHDLATTNVSLN